MRHSRFDVFDFVFTLGDDEKKTFTNIMERLILNMDIRFPCPSTCIESRFLRHNVDISTNTLNRQLFQSVRINCPLFLIVGIFLFPDELIKRRQINEFFLTGTIPEIQRISMEIINREDDIMNVANRLNGERGETSTKVISRLDVFKVINHHGYPYLWDITLTALTIFPTTVSCEQQFSILRHRLHENMAKETAFALLSGCQKE